ncbi:hypothetical protein Dsin_005595 [Dipteronia sinensis]|uniref:DUF4218 domain-containing protein n=1 Tax=Dipteronia sinensis TaxID=43782 RepID=A0AAE0AWT8_9ROSI|nr:hypothetical protein Dsin_005595 [Dipteronia sinensis]
MVHLAIHLPIEAKFAGPVAYRWMYSFERYLGTLKKYVRNKVKPEGSIVEAYVVNEALTFYSMCLGGIETKFNRPKRNDDKGKNRQECVLSVFSQKARPLGANQLINLPQNELRRAHCEHKYELESESPTNISKMQEQQFLEWIQKRMITLRHKGLVEATDELYSLFCGPDLRVNSYNNCIVNGVRFHTKARDERHTIKNNGVVVLGEHDDNAIDFYGVVTDVLQLNYILGYKIAREKRGKSRGVRLDRLITYSNGKLHVDFSSGKPKGPNAEMFSSEIRIVVKSHAPLNVEKRDEISEEQTQPLIDRVLEVMIVYLGNEYSENGSEPISEAEICIKVLGNKSGYLKGLGIVMSQMTSSSSSNVVSPENIELKEKVEHQDQHSYKSCKRKMKKSWQSCPSLHHPTLDHSEWIKILNYLKVLFYRLSSLIFQKFGPV